MKMTCFLTRLSLLCFFPAFMIMAIAATSTPAAAESLTVVQARQAFAIAENWVKRGSAPDSTIEMSVEDVAAVHVTIRLRGVMLGQGTAAIETPIRAAADRPADLMELIRQAAKQAINQAEDNFGRVHVRLPDAQPGEPTRWSDVLPHLLLDLQIARSPVELRFNRLEDIPQQFQISLDGLTLRHGAKWGWLFPGTAVTTNLNLPSQINRLFASVDMNDPDLRQLLKANGPKLYRFKVIHLIRLQPNMDVVELERGQISEPLRPLDHQGVVALSEDVVRHLLRRQQSDQSFGGDYHPVADQYAPARASNADAALICYALARASKQTELNEDLRKAAAEAANLGLRRILRDIGLIRPEDQVEDTDWHVAEASMILLALLETPGTDDLRQHAERIGGALLTMQREDGLFRTTPSLESRLASYPTQSLAAFCTVRVYERTRDEKDYQRARRALDAIWSQMPGDRFVGAMPWLVFSETTLARLGQPGPGLLRIQKDFSNINETQRGLGHAKLAPADTIGGFAFPVGLIEEPTWISASSLAAKANALRTPALVIEDQKNDWILSVALGMRFLRQLSVRATDFYYMAEPRQAIGGIRSAPWDNRLTPSASAMTLLAGVETLQTLKHIANAQNDD